MLHLSEKVLRGDHGLQISLQMKFTMQNFGIGNFKENLIQKLTFWCCDVLTTDHL